MKFGIIGLGKFGTLLKDLLEEQGHAVVAAVDHSGVDYDVLSNTDFIFPCVPISALESVLKNLKPRLVGSEVLIDVCSIKSYPQTLYKSILPNSEVILTHPNFGPESYRLNNNSSEKLNWIVWNESCNLEHWNEFQALLRQLKVKVVEIDPETHDKVIGLPHFTSMIVGQVLRNLELQKTDFQAASTKRMFEMIQGVGDDWQILSDMYKYNKYCKEFANKLNDNFEQLFSRLTS